MYAKDLLLVECPCGETVAVTAEREYGAWYWTPEECPKCLRAFTGEEPWETDEGPDPYDRWEDA